MASRCWRSGPEPLGRLHQAWPGICPLSFAPGHRRHGASWCSCCGCRCASAQCRDGGERDPHRGQRGRRAALIPEPAGLPARWPCGRRVVLNGVASAAYIGAGRPGPARGLMTVGGADRVVDRLVRTGIELTMLATVAPGGRRDRDRRLRARDRPAHAGVPARGSPSILHVARASTADHAEQHEQRGRTARPYHRTHRDGVVASTRPAATRSRHPIWVAPSRAEAVPRPHRAGQKQCRGVRHQETDGEQHRPQWRHTPTIPRCRSRRARAGRTRTWPRPDRTAAAPAARSGAAGGVELGWRDEEQASGTEERPNAARPADLRRRRTICPRVANSPDNRRTATQDGPTTCGRAEDAEGSQGGTKASGRAGGGSVSGRATAATTTSRRAITASTRRRSATR